MWIHLPQLTDARYVGDYKVEIIFDDGLRGVVDLKDELYGEIFEPLKDIEEFKKVRFDRELNTIVWDRTGADLAPEFLYEQALANAVDMPREGPFRFRGKPQ